jgi:hypothetical protein
MSLATSVTETPCFVRIRSAAAASVSAVRAFITRLTPTAASASAHPKPSPLLDAHITAVFPEIPKSSI